MKKPIYYASCKLEGMVDVIYKNVSYVIVQHQISIIQMKNKHYIVLHVSQKPWLMLNIKGVSHVI